MKKHFLLFLLSFLLLQINTASASIIREYFESFDRGIPRLYWSKVEGADKYWVYDQEQNHSIRSEALEENQAALIRFGAFFAKGELSFDYKVNSTGESFEVYLDGLQVFQRNQSTAWDQFSFNLNRGYHEIVFVFTNRVKRDEIASGSAWIDNIRFE